jgi:hypothetical protein
MATSFCAVNWREHGHHIRVYSSVNGNVVERAYDSERWFTTNYRGTGETVAATACVGGDNSEHIRVYTISRNNITEQCWDGDRRTWVPGVFSAAGIGVAAASWVSDGNVTHYRVYVVGTDHKLTEYWWNQGQWSRGELVLENVSGVAATAFVTSDKSASGPAMGKGGPGKGSGFDNATKYLVDHLLGGTHTGIRVYARGLDNKIVEHRYDGDGWSRGGFPEVYGTDHSVASYTKSKPGGDVFSLRVYVVGAGGGFVEHSYDGGGWYIGSLAMGGIDSVSATAWTTGTTIPLLGDGDESTHLRVYVKEGSDKKLVERYWDGDWEDGAFTTA